MPNPNLIIDTDSAPTLAGTSDADLIYGFDPNAADAALSGISAVRMAADLDQPLFVTAAPDDPDRIFVVEKTGRIKAVDISAQDAGIFPVEATPFLDLSTEISAVGESGLLGLAFDPNYAENGFFYVNLINTQGDTEIRRYQVSRDPNVADKSSAQLVLRIDQPPATNHKAGWLGFGPDGYLYAALGDGGGANDQFMNAQNLNSLLGKMLRLDVRGDAFPGDPTRNYAIPSDNPFVGLPGADEIWAYGLRNPWRDSFDRATGAFFIADVGQGAWEEINRGVSGANYGWPQSEGSDGNTIGVTTPIFSYGRDVGRSITGGYVYRGQSEQLHGQYFYADFVTEFVATLRLVGGEWVSTNRTAQIATAPGLSIDSIASFGEDARGNLYVVDLGGEVFRLTPTGTSSDDSDLIAAGDGDDIVFAGSANDTVSGEGGADTLWGMDGDDTLEGNDGDDRLGGGGGGDILRGGAGADFLDGDIGNDTLEGGDDNDVLRGGRGADTLTGDAGDDTFVVVRNGGADTVTDFIPGAGSEDRVDLSAFGEIRTLADVLARATQVESDTVIDLGGGNSLTLQNVARANLNVDDFVGLRAIRGDFNGEATGDLLWRHNGGMLTTWHMNGASAQANAFHSLVGTDWALAGTGDFDGDGKADLLWRHSGGTLTTWHMDGAAAQANAFQANVATEWSIAGIGDFDGDRRDDLLWRHVNGTLTTWEMNGGASAANVLQANVGTDWHIAGIGDFNGDGRDDLLWRNDNGALTTWEMNGASVSANAFTSFVSSDWNIAATGDFNADGRDDLLWRHDGGTIATWHMNGNAAVPNVFTAHVGTDWTLFAPQYDLV